jgi:hypothetical protein
VQRYSSARAEGTRRAASILPTIEKQRVYRKVHPGDTQDLTIEIKPGNTCFNVEVFSK